MPAASIGPYSIERELGRGGMGVVYLAHDTRLDRKVAIKSLPADLASDPDRLARFQREAKVLASLNHPAIATVYGMERQDNEHYLVMEFIDGRSLADRLSEGALPVQESLAVCAQVAAGVEAAHEAGIIHRDLKPANVMLVTDGRVKVLDFGLARDAAPSKTVLARLADAVTATSPVPRSDITGAGVVMGTPSYMSPEQARAKPLDKRSDIFSFGCILYECLTGRRAFTGETANDITAALLDRDPDVASLPPRTPARVRDLVARCLEKDTRLRQRDIGDARLELERAIANREWSTTGALAVAGPATSIRRWRRALSGLTLVTVAFAAGAAAWHRFARAHALFTPESAGPVTRVSIPIENGLSQTRDSAHSRPMLTPDGRTLLYIERDARVNDANRVFRRRLDEPEPVAIPGTEDAFSATLSPDGRDVIFMVKAPDQHERDWIGRVPIDASTPPTRVATIERELSGTIADLTCLPDGDLLYLVTPAIKVRRLSPSGQPVGLIDIASADHITSADHYDTYCLGPPLPGQDAVLVTGIRFSDPFTIDAAVLDLSTGRVTRLTQGGYPVYTRSGHVVVTRRDTLAAAPFDLATRSLLSPPVAVMIGMRTQEGGDECAVAISDSGTLAFVPGTIVGKSRRLVWFNEQGEVAPWGEDRRALQTWLDVSRDGRRLVTYITSQEDLFEVWGADIDRPPLHPIVRRPGFDLMNPKLSPDGSLVAYVARSSVTQSTLCVVPFDRSQEPRALLSADVGSAQFRPMAWMPDASGIIVGIAAGPRSRRLYLVPLDHPPRTSEELAPLFPADAPCWEAELSSDGTLLAYTSTESGSTEVYLRTWDKGMFGPPLQVSKAGGLGPAWSGDGSKLYYMTPGNQAIMSVHVTREPSLSVGPASLDPMTKGRIVDANLLQIACVPHAKQPFLAVQAGDDEKPAERFDLILNFFEVLNAKVPRPRN